MKCRVRPGRELPTGINGEQVVLQGGADVELPADIAHEVRHLVDEVLPTGELRAIGAGEAAAAQLQSELDKARPHERISILQAAREAAATNVDKLDALIKVEEQRIAAEQKKADAEAKKAAASKPAGAQA